MTMRPASLLSAVLVVSSPALAESIRKNLAQSADRLERAVEDNSRASPMCRNRSEPGLIQVIEQLDLLKPSDDPARFDQVAQQLQETLKMAKLTGCPDDYTKDIQRGLSDLLDAASDARRRRPNGPPPPPTQTGILFPGAEVQQGGGLGAVVAVPTVVINGFQNQSVYYAWHWKAENGAWSAWESLPAVQVNSPQFVWNNPYRALISYDALRQADSSNGRFVVHGGIFDMNGREQQGLDLQFTATYPGPPQPPGPRPFRPVFKPQPIAPPPPPAPATGQPLPPPPPMGNAQQRDCGLGLDDPGCSLTRGGPLPMDRAAFEGFMRSLRANLSESARGTMLKDTCRVQYVTARQLGAFMDLFIGENNKLDAARNCAPHVVDPANALGFATKFISSSRQREYNALLASQR